MTQGTESRGALGAVVVGEGLGVYLEGREGKDAPGPQPGTGSGWVSNLWLSFWPLLGLPVMPLQSLKFPHG